jgi:hypothetical protein
VPIDLDLAALAADGAPFARDDPGIDSMQFSRRVARTGGVVWSAAIERDRSVIHLRWDVDAAGALRGHSAVWSEEVLAVPPYVEVDFRFTPVEDPVPIAAPEPGAPLDVDALDLPGSG